MNIDVWVAMFNPRLLRFITADGGKTVPMASGSGEPDAGVKASICAPPGTAKGKKLINESRLAEESESGGH